MSSNASAGSSHLPVHLPVMGGRGSYTDPIEVSGAGRPVDYFKYDVYKGNSAPGRSPVPYLLCHYKTMTPLYYAMYDSQSLPIVDQMVWAGPNYEFKIRLVTGNKIYVSPQSRWTYAVYGKANKEKFPRIMYGCSTKKKIKFYENMIVDYFHSWGYPKKRGYFKTTNDLWAKRKRKDNHI